MRLPTKAGLHDRIIRSGIEIGTELGEDGLTMRAIASRLGISVTNIYQHFESKAAILREIRFHGLGLLQDALVEAEVPGDPPACIRRMCHGYVRFARTNPWLYVLLFDGAQLDWHAMPPGERRLALAPMETCRAAFEDGVRTGHFRGDLDVAQAVMLTWASLHGVASLLLRRRLGAAGPAFPFPETESFLTAFVDHLVRGFTS